MTSTQDLPGDIPTLTSAVVADMLGVEPSRVKQLVKERVLIGVRKGGDVLVPAECLMELPADQQSVVELKGRGTEEPRSVRVTHEPLRYLRGTVLLLEDGGYTRKEIFQWLWGDNAWLEARPIDLMRNGGHKQVNRIASTQAW